ncbi:hypothetical protein [Dongshaea marina]|uniref:hypothetical protein n=1 Tax=Dongshaea marina TaxID=2047966 RepID=UPI000D3E29B1|nr:hypothetical protein [Dongshaea marina]
MGSHRKIIGFALLLSVMGEIVLWGIYGLYLFPGHPAQTLLWSLTCALAMGAVLGGGIIILGLDKGAKGWVFPLVLLVSLIVFSLCNLVCYRLDLAFDYWGSVTHPWLFLGEALLVL